MFVAEARAPTGDVDASRGEERSTPRGDGTIDRSVPRVHLHVDLLENVVNFDDVVTLGGEGNDLGRELQLLDAPHLEVPPLLGAAPKARLHDGDEVPHQHRHRLFVHGIDDFSNLDGVRVEVNPDRIPLSVDDVDLLVDIVIVEDEIAPAGVGDRDTPVFGVTFVRGKALRHLDVLLVRVEDRTGSQRRDGRGDGKNEHEQGHGNSVPGLMKRQTVCGNGRPIGLHQTAGRVGRVVALTFSSPASLPTRRRAP